MVAFFSPIIIPMETKSISKPDTDDNGSTLLTYTFSSLNFGSATGSKEIFITGGALSSGGVRTLSSASIDGKTTQTYNIGNTSKAFLCHAVTSSATGDFTVTFDGNMVGCSIQVYRVIRTNRGQTFFDAFSTSDTLGAAATILTMSASVPANGFAFSSLFHLTTSQAISVAGDFTADHGVALANFYWRGSSLTSPYASATATKSADFTWVNMASDSYAGGIWTFRG